MLRSCTRRTFLLTTSAAAAAATLPRVSFARRRLRPDKLRIGVVGTANQAGWNISQLGSEQIVALCDVDSNYLDAAAAKVQGVKKFRDFREMLAAPLDLDAVLIAAPDHIHAPATAMALRAGKPVYCEKPLAHTVEEARIVAGLAREKKLATQMGTQIHAGDNYRRVVELVRSGIIGHVKEAHVWVGKSWGGGSYGPAKEPPTTLDWELWLGPAPEHAFSEGIHPGNWRRFWSYGTGTLGDMACHHMDLSFWALDLRHPTSIHAEGPPVDAVGTPEWLVVHYEHPAKGDRPGVKLTWYDGGKHAELLKPFKNKDGTPLQWGDGTLFVGENGMILADYDNHVLIRDNKVTDFTPPPATIPNSIGHHAEWFAAIRAGSPTTCNFEYSGALSEAVLLGNVSYRTGKKIEWDAANLRATNAPEAEKLIRHSYRSGWVL